jgi:hypothetical protein
MDCWWLSSCSVCRTSRLSVSTAVDVEQQAPEEGSLTLALGVIASVCRLDVDRGVAAYALLGWLLCCQLVVDYGGLLASAPELLPAVVQMYAHYMLRLLAII